LRADLKNRVHASQKLKEIGSNGSDFGGNKLVLKKMFISLDNFGDGKR
jgi:hypothetical protein